MKLTLKALSVFLISLTLYSCSKAKEKETFKPKIVYRTDNLIVTQLSDHTYQHTSYFLSEDFGKVDCNGLVVRDKDEVIVFDTPADSTSSEELIKWVENGLKNKIVAVIPTHFHFDCVGGLKEFHRKKIPSYANFRTIEFTREKKFNVPQKGFKDSLILKVGNEKVIARFFGEGHTKDNVIGYFPSENIMFGGCLIKEVGAGKGNLEDANISEWSKTVEKIKKKYPNVSLVVPGHGKYGNYELLDYTINLFKAPK
ncbi:BcII family subclass B1 metallo-beta-lactamase [Chryseobacterium sp. Alg-005]|uniref:subclass B1 metallo-beta-lactamase n=1 Tax=Chryseobacterium sp. Alg-005 TaxID=3159516 RepID=UPI003555AF83